MERKLGEKTVRMTDFFFFFDRDHGVGYTYGKFINWIIENFTLLLRQVTVARENDR